MIDLKQKQRHGCVTWWLWVAIIVNLVVAVSYSVLMFDATDGGLALGCGLLGMLGILNVLGSILLMRWNKTGFWLFFSSSLLGVVINIGVLDVSPAASLSFLVSVLIWWGILQIKKNGVSAWSLMGKGWDYKHCRHLYQVFAGVLILVFVLALVAFGMADRKPDGLMPDVSVREEENTDPVEVLDSVVVSDSVVADTVAVDEETVEPQPKRKEPERVKKEPERVNKEPEHEEKKEPVHVKEADEEDDDVAAVEAEQMLKASIEAIALPMDAGSGITITDLSLGSRYLVYTAICDEDLVDIEVLRLSRDEVKKNVGETLASSDPTVGYFMKLCITAHRGVAYKYVGDTSGEECWIRFSISDLKKLVGK